MAGQGANFKLRMRPETTAGTAAIGNYDQVPCFSFGLSPTQALDQDALLSATDNRDAGDPFYGLVRVAGEARVPLDTVHFPRWLRLLLGAPTTTGDGPYTHVFRSGAPALPSNSIEKAYPDIGRYEMAVGAKANTLAVRMDPEGAAEATVGLLALAESASGSSGAGSAIVTPFSRFFAVQGSISRGGTVLGEVTAAEFTFSNDADGVAVIRDDYRLGGIDLGLAGASGSITVRFNDHTFYEAAGAGQPPTALECAYTIDADTSVVFRFARSFLAKQGKAIEGPRGITETYRFVAGPDVTDGVMTVTVKNAVESYATN